MRWIGHAGLAAGRPGGAPSRATLDQAVSLNVDMLELDVCLTAEGALVLRHDDVAEGGRPVETLTLAVLRAADPELLTLDEAIEHLAGRVSVLIDVKGTACLPALAGWLAAGGAGAAVCTDDADALRMLRERAPAAPRWRTLPMVGSGRGERRRRIAACALRRRLPARLEALALEVGAAGLSVDRWALTPRLCRAAHGLGLPVAAWTVNRGGAARHAVRAGVDLITTDCVEAMRAAVAIVA